MVSPVDSRVMETKDILASIEETKDLIRRVRTPGGARRYGQPIGSIIVPDAPVPGARRKRSKRTASTPTSPRSAEPKKTRQRGAQERVTTLKGRVAPEAEYEGVDESFEVNTTSDGKDRWWAHEDPEKRLTYYENEAPFRERVDFEFLQNATVKDAQKILKSFGVHYKTTPKFKELAKKADTTTYRARLTGDLYTPGGDSYRDFMVSLAESVRLMESEFPGWSKIHGRMYTEAKSNGKGFVAYNITYRNSGSEDAPITLSSQLRGAPNDLYVAGDMSLKDTGANSRQTATVFGPQMLTGPTDRPGDSYRSTTAYPIPHNAGGEAVQFLGEGAGNYRVAGMMSTMLHEFGHATAASIAGDIAPDLDDRTDVNASHRRWYKEYYSEALMKFYSDNGVFKWTGKQPDYEYLADHSRMVAHYADATDRFNASGGDMQVMRDATERGSELAQIAGQSRKRSGAAPFTQSGRASDFRPWIRMLEREGYIEPGSFSALNLEAIAPSQYAATKPVEMEAESWVSYMLETETTKSAAEWGHTMHEMMTWYMDDMANPDFNTTDQEA